MKIKFKPHNRSFSNDPEIQHWAKCLHAMSECKCSEHIVCYVEDIENYVHRNIILAHAGILRSTRF